MDKNVFDAQSVLKESGFYDGKVDGISGPRTLSAVSKSEGNLKIDGRWNASRRLIAAMQRELNRMGHDAGSNDGLRGPKTEAAFLRFRNKTGAAEKSPVPAKVSEKSGRAIPNFKVPLRRDSAQMRAVFGEPGDKNPKNASGKCILPFPFVIAWDTSKTVKSFSCHEKAAPVFESIFREAAAHYGESEFRRLRLDRFGGCYNPRMMRGSGSLWSTHAWGVAVDLDPERNQLKWNKNRASFAKKEYESFWKIVEGHGCVSLGRDRDYDWMHFQLARE